ASADGAAAEPAAATFLNGSFRNGGGFRNGGFRNGGGFPNRGGVPHGRLRQRRLPQLVTPTDRRGAAMSPGPGPLELLVLQPTPFCNIDCAYCYLPNRSSRQRMSEYTLARTFERVFSSPFLSESLTVLW